MRAHGLPRKRGGRCAGTNRGIGLSLFFHGSGFTGGGEVKLASKASLELTARGVRILVAQHRDRPGHAHHARADRRRRARHAVRRDRGRRRRHRRRARQRADGRVAHLHGRRARSCSAAPRRCASGSGGCRPREYFRAARPARRSRRSTSSPARSHWDDDTYRGDAYATYGWGVRRRRGGGRSATPSRCTPIAVHGRARDRQGDSSGARARADRGRHRAGTRLRAARGGGDARRRDGQRAAHQLHHPDDARHAARSTS